MAYRVRFYMDMNAREAMHVIELRTSPQGHPSYRRVCQLMHRAIADTAGHRAIAAAMQFVDHSESGARTAAVRASLEKKRAARLKQSAVAVGSLSRQSQTAVAHRSRISRQSSALRQ